MVLNTRVRASSMLNVVYFVIILLEREIMVLIEVSFIHVRQTT